MLQHFKKQISLLAVVLLILVPLAVPATVSADSIADSVCGGTSLQFNPGSNSGSCQKNNQNAGDSFNDILTNAINIFSIVVGIIAVIMIIVGGFKFITSAGQSEAVASARKTIMYALVGLVVVVLAQFIVHFVIGKVVGIGGTG